MLHTEFQLEKFGTTLNPLIAQTKLYLASLLKSQPKPLSETFIPELISSYRISDALRKRIEEYQLSREELKRFVSTFYLPTKKSEEPTDN
ncbi:MAG: hypothetical protein LBH96_03815 [Candidatus Peribacteria bacterium]|nr:hypothetical protein [Candidatus Peribacteria bacterium]